MLKGDVQIYYLILVIAILLVIGARNLMKTRVGRAFMSIRDDDIAAEVMGVNLTIFKTMSFAVSAFYAGIAGGLYGFVVSFFDPFSFNMILSIIFLVMVVVGGLGSLGAIMGAVLITYLPVRPFEKRGKPALYRRGLGGHLQAVVYRDWTGQLLRHRFGAHHDRHCDF